MKDVFLVTMCPHCGIDHNMMACLDGDSTIEDGDYSLCSGCGEWRVFINGGKAFRKPTDKEQAEIDGSPACRNLKKAWERANYVRRMREP